MIWKLIDLCLIVLPETPFDKCVFYQGWLGKNITDPLFYTPSMVSCPRPISVEILFPKDKLLWAQN